MEDKRWGPEVAFPAGLEGPENVNSPSEGTWWRPQEGVSTTMQSQKGPEKWSTELTWTEEAGNRDWSPAELGGVGTRASQVDGKYRTQGRGDAVGDGLVLKLGNM
ncbi:hypothetical protein Y1Q_0014024 [Alligator mississippiensis]|uniref:Uncharacterized protein n=1 Tax=Alligator mississippiensis TaxID=8496 RepID=A0A151PDX1_ALLMI|nr:hypothetical protein Y1Q_0014024 [Alligator mississippiensis]